MEALIISCLHLTDIATRSKTNSGVRLAMFISKLTAYHFKLFGTDKGFKASIGSKANRKL